VGGRPGGTGPHDRRVRDPCERGGVKVFVGGATGVAGREAVRALVAAGHDVTAAGRTTAKRELVRSWGADPVEVDLFDPAATGRAVDDHQAVCNLTTRIPSLTRAGLPGAWKENDRIRRQVSANLVDAALAAGTAHFVQESIGLLYPDRGDEWITEEVLPQPTAVTRSALEAEAHVARFTERGRTGVVLRFAQFYGPDAIHSIEMVRMAGRLGIAPTIGDPRGYLSWIHRDDLGPAVVAALNAPAGVYNVGDDVPLRRSELHTVLAESLGRPRLREIGRLGAWLGGSRTESASRSQRLANSAFRVATGWAPTVPTAGEGWRSLIARGDRTGPDLGP
jgi:nucleoside-diphosphate-sugar epimerase